MANCAIWLQNKLENAMYSINCTSNLEKDSTNTITASNVICVALR